MTDRLEVATSSLGEMRRALDEAGHELDAVADRIGRIRTWVGGHMNGVSAPVEDHLATARRGLTRTAQELTHLGTDVAGRQRLLEQVEGEPAADRPIAQAARRHKPSRADLAK